MEYIAIGTITNTHGIRGALKVKTDSDFKEERYSKGNILYIKFKNEYRQVTVNSYFSKGSLDVVTFDELNTIEEAEIYKGSTLYVEDSNRQKLGKDTFYFDMLIGLDVYQANQLVGKVKAIMQVPQGEMLRVERDNDKDALVPFSKQFVTKVSLDEQRIDVIDLEGLL